MKKDIDTPSLPPDLAPDAPLMLFEDDSETQSIECDSPVPESDSEEESSDENNDDNLYIFDLRVDCVSEDAKKLSIQLIELHYDDLDDSGLFSLKKVNSTTWKTDSLIILPFDISRIEIYVCGEGHYRVGLLLLEEDALDALREGGQTKSNLEFEDNLIALGAMKMNMAFTYSTEYQCPKKYAPVDEIALLQQVVQLIPKRYPDLPSRLNNLGLYLRTRFNRFGDITDISEAISSHQQAIQLTRKGHPNLHIQLNSLGNSFHIRFERCGNVADISEAISAQQQAVQLTPEGHPSLPLYLNNLGLFFLTQFHRLGDIADISQAISFQQQALLLSPKEHHNFPSQLNSLGLSFRTRFNRFGDITDISEAISFHQQAIQLTPKGHSHLPLYFDHLGTSFRIRFDQFGDISNISEAISFHQQAVHLAPKGHPDLPTYIANLGTSFQTRFDCFGNIDDISAAISFQREALLLTPKGHPKLPPHLHNLGLSLRIRFDCLGEIADISEAISFQQQAVQLTPNEHPDLASRLDNLGSSFLSRFDRFGDIIDISKSISLHQQAVQLTPKGHPNLPLYFSNLGIAFRTRFNCFRDITDISEAISFLQLAVQLIPEGNPKLPAYLNNLGLSFRIRFNHSKEISDISKAISLLQLAVQLTPSKHPDLPSGLNNLGLSFLTRFQHFEDTLDIFEAISFQRQAVQLAPKAHPDLPLYLNNLGLSFWNRFRRFGKIADISKALSFQQRALLLTPEGHPTLPLQLITLGISFHTRFDHLGNILDISEAISHFRLAATLKSGSPLHRLISAENWAKLARDRDPTQELEAYTLVINFMSEVIGIEQTIELRHKNLTATSTLAASAVAAAFLHGRPDLALEWLEQGRCLVWNQLSQLRTRSVSDELQTKYPDLAAKFRQLSIALADAGSRQGLSTSSVGMHSEDTFAEKVSLEGAATAHVKAAQEYNQLLNDIRSIPEFHDFLRPRTATEILAHLPKSGTVILINVHEDRCDSLALVSGCDKPLHIPLVKFTHKRAVDLRSQLSMYISRYGWEMRDVDRAVRPVGLAKRVELILHTLWLEVVEPIFDVLGFNTRSPESPPRRIWWCTTGPLASLPIHAAGVYREGGTCVSDFAVSSYIPTVRMLVERIKVTHEGHNNRLLLVSQANPNPHQIMDGDKERTVSLPEIPGVDEETHTLKKLMEDSDIGVLRLAGLDATISNVQEEAMTYQSIHLACHGTQDFKKPLQSGFFLLDGRLKLSEIMKRHDPTADLAFLSACETGTGDQTLTEEAVHLAAGMLAVGYRSVVATMWSIKDDYGPEVAEDFYSELLRSGEYGGKVRLDGAGAAFALHYATQRLRKKVGDTDSGLLIWLPYVHFGI